MSDIHCIIVEDEPLAVKVLADYIAQVPFLNLAGTFKDALHAADYLRANAPELIFLDIHLPRLKGLAFLRTLAKQPAVIVTTAYHQYAVEGFELNVTDYLLKPFDFERFLQAVNKVNILSNGAGIASGTAAKDFLYVSVQKRNVKIWFSDIFYIEGQKEYIKVVTVKGNYITKMGTQLIEKLLPPHLFKRVHRSFIVSVDKIESYSAEMIEVGGRLVPIGRVYRSVLENL